MRYELLNPVDPNNSTIETVLLNRGISKEEAYHYLNTTDADINDFRLFGEEVLKSAYDMVMATIQKAQKCFVIVDSDCDGFTSSAVLINYLHDYAPEWVETNLFYHMHSGKQHGLSGVEIPSDISLVIVPDAGSNDYREHKELKARGIGVIVLDHHEAESLSEDAIIINNQLSAYPNKEFSGVGVTWQFCRYMDSMNGTSFADAYLDMVALGLDADMMSLRSLETKHLINKGLEIDRVTNPFFYSMKEKNSFSLKGKLTPIGVAFYIAPFVNSMVRSGTIDEKTLLFKSMLKHEAFKRVPSTKRGHAVGEEETLVTQAIRTATNVKNRQTRSQEAGLEVLEGMISSQDLLDNKILMFRCETGKVAKNIAGLVANKFQSKYQRNTLILFKGEKGGEVVWQGSARAYSKTSIESFRDLCLETGLVEYAQGHAGAFGLGILDKNIEEFIRLTNEALAGDTGEPTYYVDYVYDGPNVTAENVLDIARLGNLWGQDMPEALVAIKGLKVTPDMLTLMSPDKKPTIKIALPNGTSIIKFGSSQKEYEKLLAETGYIEISLVGTCNANEWMGNISPQILMKDYEVTASNKYIF